MTEPSGQYPDPEAIRQKRIAELEQKLAAVREHYVGSQADAWAETLEAELSRLRNEQPKGGDDRECTCHPDDDPPRPCPRKFAYSECVAAASPSPLPEPQDVREAICRALCKENGTAQCAPICLSHFSTQTTDGKCPEAERVWGRKADFVLPALAQSDAQPVGWRNMTAAPKDGTRILLSASGGLFVGSWRKAQFSDEIGWMTDANASNVHLILRPDGWMPLYIVPPRPDASRLIEAAEIERLIEELEWACKRGLTFAEVAFYDRKDDILRALRSRAPDRSAPRSDKGGA